MVLVVCQSLLNNDVLPYHVSLALEMTKLLVSPFPGESLYRKAYFQMAVLCLDVIGIGRRSRLIKESSHFVAQAQLVTSKLQEL